MISTKNPEAIVHHLKNKFVDVDTESVAATSLDGQPEKPNTALQSASMLCRARALVEENKISFNPKMHIFNVQGTNDVRVVSLYPKEKCSCPADSLCYHILGVNLSLGATKMGVPKKRNLTQLCKNTRSRKDKKSGRKRPRTDDIEVDNKQGMYVCQM